MINPENNLQYLITLFSLSSIWKSRYLPNNMCAVLEKKTEAHLFSTNQSPSYPPTEVTLRLFSLGEKPSGLTLDRKWKTQRVIIMSMWIPNKDMGNGETYIITHYEDILIKLGHQGNDRTTSFKSLFRVQRDASVYLLSFFFFFFK